MNSPSIDSLKGSQIGLNIDTEFQDNNNHLPRSQPCVGSWNLTCPVSPQYIPLNFREDASTPIRNILNNQFDELEYLSDDILRALSEQCMQIIVFRERNSTHNKKLSELKKNTLTNSSTNIKYTLSSPHHKSNSSLSSIFDKQSLNNEQCTRSKEEEFNKDKNNDNISQEKPLTRTISFQSDEENNYVKEFYIGTIIDLCEMKASVQLKEYSGYHCYFPNGFKYYGEKNDKVRIQLRFINHTDKKIILNFINKVYEKDIVIEGIYRTKIDKNNHISFIEVKSVKHASFPKNFIHELNDGDKISCKIYDIFDFKERGTNKITGIGLILTFIQKIDN